MGTDIYSGLPSGIGWIVFIILWLVVMSAVVAVVAEKHGRSGGLWFVAALLVSPLLAVPLLIMSTKTDAASAHTGPATNNSKPQRLPPGTHPCPKCDAPVLRSREICPACGVRLVAGARR